MDWLGATLTFCFTGGLCAAGGWMFVSSQRKARFLLDTPTSKIRSAAQGYVELYGLLADGSETQIAPLSGTPCCWWDYTIEEYRKRSGNKSPSWQLLERRTSEAMLELDDGTGRCLIDPRGAQLMPQTRQSWQGSQRHPRQPENKHWLAAVLTSGRRYRYTERRFHQREPLYAIGHFYSIGGGHQVMDVDKLQANIIRRWKQDFPALLKRFDRNGDGRFDDAEWQQVQNTARTKAEQQARQTSVAAARHFMRKPDENLPFILSSNGEDALARSLRWQSFWGALLCIGGALATAYLFNAL